MEAKTDSRFFSQPAPVIKEIKGALYICFACSLPEEQCEGYMVLSFSSFIDAEKREQNL